MASDARVKTQVKALEELRSYAYFRSFEPRGYETYYDRHYNPQAYLDDIGIEKIKEMAQHGYSLRKIAKVIDVSFTFLTAWLTNTPEYFMEIEATRKFIAEDLAWSALEDIQTAPGISEEITRASQLANHKRWMAERFDKDLFGAKSVSANVNSGTQVVYNINLEEARKAVEAAKPVIESTARLISKLPEPDFALDKSLDMLNEPAD